MQPECSVVELCVWLWQARVRFAFICLCLAQSSRIMPLLAAINFAQVRADIADTDVTHVENSSVFLGKVE